MIYFFLALVVVGVLVLLRHRRNRARLYRELAKRREQVMTAAQGVPLAPAVEPSSLRSEFERERIVRVPGFLPEETLRRLQAEVLANRDRVERSYIPGHKKGGTLSYEAIHRSAPGCLALYHAPALRNWLSALVGVPLRPTADHDQSSCSLLYYDRAGDHIGWHLDHNFYRGRHFTILISLFDRAAGGGRSAGRLQRRCGGETQEVATPENTLVIFEGARVSHRATAVGDGDDRVVLSMTLCTDARVGVLREGLRRIKDMAYYGPRILFD